MEIRVSYNLTSEVTSHHFCHILLIRSKLLCSFHSKGEEITEGYEYQKARITACHLRICLPQWFSRALVLSLAVCKVSTPCAYVQQMAVIKTLKSLVVVPALPLTPWRLVT